MIYAPRMLLIGSTGRNVGKTLLADALIRKFSASMPVVGAKVTAVAQNDGQCPRGGKGCGVCSSLEGAWCITKEEGRADGKDTQRLLAAGATSVYWLRVLKAHLEEGARTLLETVGPDSWVICESNSLRTVLQPGLFLMVTGAKNVAPKPSAADVIASADLLISFDGERFDFDLEHIVLSEKGWRLAPGFATKAAGSAK